LEVLRGEKELQKLSNNAKNDNQNNINDDQNNINDDQNNINDNQNNIINEHPIFRTL
jgi:hypothetical protein